jgi:endonuclease YncB( thermonuclease family)
LILAVGLLLEPFSALPAAAAEVLQVRSGVLLQVGDQNRSYPVQLGCISVTPEQSRAAEDWLRQELPRRTRVNLRPLGSADGVLLARVQVLRGGDDLGSGLISAGLAQPLPSLIRPQGCPSSDDDPKEP